MGYSRSRIVDAEQPDRVLALTQGQGVSIGTPPAGLDKMPVDPIVVEDGPDLPPLWQVFGAARRPDGHWALPVLSSEVASPDAALHLGPQFVLLETAAFDQAAEDAAEASCGTDRLEALSSHVMFLARGKVGPFRADAESGRRARWRGGGAGRPPRRGRRRSRRDRRLLSVPAGDLAGSAGAARSPSASPAHPGRLPGPPGPTPPTSPSGARTARVSQRSCACAPSVGRRRGRRWQPTRTPAARRADRPGRHARPTPRGRVPGWRRPPPVWIPVRGTTAPRWPGWWRIPTAGGRRAGPGSPPCRAARPRDRRRRSGSPMPSAARPAPRPRPPDQQFGSSASAGPLVKTPSDSCASRGTHGKRERWLRRAPSAAASATGCSRERRRRRTRDAVPAARW